MPQKNSKRTGKRKEPTAHASAVAVLELMNSGKCPDFLYQAIRATIKHACESLDPDPFYPKYDGSPDGVDMGILMAVFSRMGKQSLSELESTKAALARHIAAIYRHPDTPARLYNHVANFVTDGTSMKISACEASHESLVDTSGNITLAEEWSWNPRTIERVIDLYHVYDHSEEANHA